MTDIGRSKAAAYEIPTGRFLARPETMRLAIEALQVSIKRGHLGPRGVRADMARRDVIKGLLTPSGVVR